MTYGVITTTHGYMDYVAGAVDSRVPIALGVPTGAYSLMTNYEGRVYPAIALNTPHDGSS